MSQQQKTSHRVLLSSGSRISGTTSENVVSLQTGSLISGVVGAEWISCSIPGYVLQIQELPTSGFLSNGVGYWRFCNDLTNGRYSDFKEAPFPPRTLQRLSLRWLNPNGTLATDLPEHCVEIELLCDI